LGTDQRFKCYWLNRMMSVILENDFDSNEIATYSLLPKANATWHGRIMPTLQLLENV